MTPPVLLDEFSLIRRFFVHEEKDNSVIKGIGDDCAILQPSPGKQQVVSIDTQVAGRHFPYNATPEEIASRALCTSISDLAAMGAVPRWFTLALTLPDATTKWLDAFSRSLFDTAKALGIILVGGDTTKGPLCVSIQVHGEVSPQAVLQRSQAKAGDVLAVTGTLGDGAAALAMLQQHWQVPNAEEDYLKQRFYRPLPPLGFAHAAANHLHAAIDISDGLLADAQHICQASHVGITIERQTLPLSPSVLQYAGEQAYDWALCGGDDYQLLFTCTEQKWSDIQRIAQAHHVVVTRIGVVDNGTAVKCLDNGKPYTTESKGYQHFV